MLSKSLLPHSPKFLPAFLLVGSLAAQGHDHSRSHHHAVLTENTAGILSIDDVLAMEQNRGLRQDSKKKTVAGRSGDGGFVFEVIVTSKNLPKKVFEPNPFDGRKRKILHCAHGGFAYDYRKGKGEVYWSLQGGGIIRVHRDRSKIEMVETDPKMLKLNMHNATFFEHKDQAMIAWPANGGASVFLTDVDGKLLRTIGRPTMLPYSKGAPYAPTDVAYLDGMLWITDGYASKFVMSYDLDAKKWTGTIFGGRSKKIEPGKFGINHGITIHKGLIYVADRFFARIHSYKPETKFDKMFPLPTGSKPCDFEFFVVDGKLYGVAGGLMKPAGSKDKGASVYIVDMETMKVVSTIKPKDELGLGPFTHLHDAFATVDDGVVTLFCQAWNLGDFAVLRQVPKAKKVK
ncbi:MAG: hypothetical protein VX951_13305 [Planctomycetota bacterium]|nr:hypothetical protein [Planctomycetota bacterium]